MKFKKWKKLKSKLKKTFFAISYWYKKKTISVKNFEDTIHEVINSQRSLCRYGDGEFHCIIGEDIPFQSVNKKLAKRLKEVLASDDDNIMVCVNYALFNQDKITNEIGKEFYRIWSPKYMPLVNHFIKDGKQYYDATFNQPYVAAFNLPHVSDDIFETYYNSLQQIWKDKDITIICGHSVFNNIETNIFDCAKSVEFLYAPSKNAFSQYDSILEQAKAIDKKRLIIAILGPTATILAYDLAKAGHRTLDFGHVAKDYDAYKKKMVCDVAGVIKFYSPD